MMMCLKFSVLVGSFDFCLWYACEVGFLTFGGGGFVGGTLVDGGCYCCVCCLLCHGLDGCFLR